MKRCWFWINQFKVSQDFFCELSPFRNGWLCCFERRTSSSSGCGIGKNTLTDWIIQLFIFQSQAPSQLPVCGVHFCSHAASTELSPSYVPLTGFKQNSEPVTFAPFPALPAAHFQQSNFVSICEPSTCCAEWKRQYESQSQITSTTPFNHHPLCYCLSVMTLAHRPFCLLLLTNMIRG